MTQFRKITNLFSKVLCRLYVRLYNPKNANPFGCYHPLNCKLSVDRLNSTGRDGLFSVCSGALWGLRRTKSEKFQDLWLTMTNFWFVFFLCPESFYVIKRVFQVGIRSLDLEDEISTKRLELGFVTDSIRPFLTFHMPRTQGQRILERPKVVEELSNCGNSSLKRGTATAPTCLRRELTMSGFRCEISISSVRQFHFCLRHPSFGGGKESSCLWVSLRVLEGFFCND